MRESSLWNREHIIVLKEYGTIKIFLALSSLPCLLGLAWETTARSQTRVGKVMALNYHNPAHLICKVEREYRNISVWLADQKASNYKIEMMVI